ncbi:MAG: helix-turn-helix domain-containing protein [Alphaproteobacteria bacterium]|nr:helix-turn-helix domain-containing protein [Alphaproteobacteria bacterium]
MAEHFYYSSSEAAHYLGLTSATLAVYRCNGTGPNCHNIAPEGKRPALVYRRPDLDAWAKGRDRRNKAKRAVFNLRDLKREG